MNKGWRCFAVTAIICLATAAFAKDGIPTPGLYVKNGVLLKNGKPYYGIGVNYHDAFVRYMTNPEDRSYQKGFEHLLSYDVNFIRFRLGGFWPNDWRTYCLNDKEAYFKRLDQFVADAEKMGIGLIPSFFWLYSAPADLSGEPMDALGDPYSKTNAFIRDFTSEVVARYKDSPAIWAWEFGNEYMLFADHPDRQGGTAHRAPELGTPATRTVRDYIRRTDVRQAYREFAKAIRKIDKYRMISTGDSAPRSCAYNTLLLNTEWGEMDTPEQWDVVFRGDSPELIDTLSIHLYEEHRQTYFQTKPSIHDFVAFCAASAKKAEKPLFIGEFGSPEDLKSLKTSDLFTEMIHAIVANRIQLSAVWVYDFSPQDGQWNITPDNNRAYMLTELQKANQRLRAAIKETDCSSKN